MSVTLSQDEFVFVSLSPYCLGEMSKKTESPWRLLASLYMLEMHFWFSRHL